jgi:hypothetical protein
MKPRRRRKVPPAALCFMRDSGVVAEIAAECVRLLHQRLARHHFEDLPVFLLVLHVLWLFAADDNHRADQLVVFLAEVNLAYGPRAGRLRRGDARFAAGTLRSEVSGQAFQVDRNPGSVCTLNPHVVVVNAKD